MAGETQVTLVANLTRDPDLRYTQNGKAVATLGLASTPRRFDRQTNEWVDGDPMFLNASLWGQAAENAIESFTKGMRVIVVGNLVQRSFEDRDGNRRTVVEIEASEVGASIRFKSATVHEPNQALNQVREQVRQPDRDPWGQGGFQDEVPF